jgi:hypothetical protein
MSLSVDEFAVEVENDTQVFQGIGDREGAHEDPVLEHGRGESPGTPGRCWKFPRDLTWNHGGPRFQGPDKDWIRSSANLLAADPGQNAPPRIGHFK